MSNSDAYNALKAGKEEWESFRGKAFRNGSGASLNDGRIDLRSADLSHMNLSCYDLSRVDFGTVDENFPTLLSGAKLSNTYLFGSRFCGTRFLGADLSGANITGAEFDSVIFDEKSSLRNAKGDAQTIFRKCNLNGVDLSGADLRGVDLSDSILRDANLTGVSFIKARLGGTFWQGARIDETTSLDMASFPSHPVGLDQSESMLVPFGVNWQSVRWIGSFKILPLSLMGLASCFIFFPFAPFSPTSISLSGGFTHELFTLFLTAFAFMLSGSFLYSCRCPEEIRHFSVAEWVHLAKNPRPVYLAKSLQRRAGAAVSLALVVFGLIVLALALKTWFV